MTSYILRIDSGFACFGLDIKDGKVVLAAPICKWALGKSADYIEKYWKSRGAEVMRIYL